MSVDRMKRVNVLLQREIAAGMYRILRPGEVDLASITVTSVSASRDLRQARVMVSVRCHQSKRKKVLTMLRSHRKEFQDYVSNSVVLKYTPRLFFSLDSSIAKGSNVLDTISHIAVPETEVEPEVSDEDYMDLEHLNPESDAPKSE
ncbi:MAG: ribosome-binding factor A [Kiritimatiellae bacterium]|nr:ribosome-binding factor A [Kiritimatiellia bacterium]